jgi:hypothetical protein
VVADELGGALQKIAGLVEDGQLQALGSVRDVQLVGQDERALLLKRRDVVLESILRVRIRP